MGFYTVFLTASKFLQLINFAIFIYCMFTWFAPRSAGRYWLERFISPFCAPFQTLARRLSMRWGSPFDFTCLFTMIGLEILDGLLWMLYNLLLRGIY